MMVGDEVSFRRSQRRRPCFSRGMKLSLLLAALLAYGFIPVTFAAGSANGHHAPAADISRIDILILGIPLSPLHSVIAIGQELCLRGHNVTVGSMGNEGLQKVNKYTPKCKVNYVDLGPWPLTRECIDQAMINEIGATNSSVGQIKAAKVHIMSKVWNSLQEPLDALLKHGTWRPDFALVSIPLSGIPAVLKKHGVDFAIK